MGEYTNFRSPVRSTRIPQFTSEPDLSRIGPERPPEKPEKRTLPRTVGTQNRKKLAFGEPERDPVPRPESDHTAVPDRELPERAPTLTSLRLSPSRLEAPIRSHRRTGFPGGWDDHIGDRRLPRESKSGARRFRPRGRRVHPSQLRPPPGHPAAACRASHSASSSSIASRASEEICCFSAR